MKFFRSFVGYCIAGMIVMAVWSQLGTYGIFGGYLAAIIIIGPMWYMNHYINLTGNEDDAAFVDMGLAISICGIMRDTFIQGGAAFATSLPTIVFVIFGATLGGITAAYIEKDMAKKKEFTNENPREPGLRRSDFEKLKETKEKILRSKQIKVFQKKKKLD
ncbi:hypothetical protein J3U21_06475 [Gilliamella sp. B2776]|uniref:Lin0368 family putative glycerol transporter subunit n=1 Tax=unclassified Gilliamella TaxID=2685620 RepID=UPI002269F3CA|nr:MULTISPECIES: hypothetical protein [unclassified Gilliamella]MCX8650021.1 hypothetical protein [Gilliamella sp. B2779]MCX8654954.1 hypothetical protein [Gilliamella sp. B2737]MCX8656597.1 hypothetical protein [Gilliamella sp. B2894]MCX8665389.1 hypothetical protein [Gilliamella sp. B2887]MCX8691794.1 hypothetical protein [Gilliamella sp. B2776]